MKGKAKEPVYLSINNQEATLVNASHLWGKDTWETDYLIQAPEEELLQNLAKHTPTKPKNP